MREGTVRQIRGPEGQGVLLVEDETRLRDMLLRGMREMGFMPTGVTSAEQALRVMKQSAFPVLVVDLNLPGVGGLEFLRTVREQWPTTQAVILTGFGDLDAARQAIHLEVADFLTKPCALGDLEVALSRAFRRLQQARPEALDPKPPPSDEADMDSDDAEPARPPMREKAAPAAAPRMEFAPREGSADLSMEDIERRTILAALEKHENNRAAAADELGISIRKLYYRLAQYQKQGVSLP